VRDHPRQGAGCMREWYRPSEREGTQTSHNAASDSMKDATTLMSLAGNGSSEQNQDSSV